MTVMNKKQRLLGLLLALSSRERGGLTKSQIFKLVPGYSGSEPDTIEKLFTRDKDDLRELGIDLIVEEHEHGETYRLGNTSANITKSLTDSERMLTHAAANLWSFSAERDFAAKLQAAFSPAPSMPTSELSGTKPLATIARAIDSGHPVQFNYVTSKAKQMVRTVEPWYLFLQEGNLYVRGFDRDREAERFFRLSRIILDDKLTILDEPITHPGPQDENTGLDSVSPVFAVRKGTSALIRQHSSVLENPKYDAHEGWEYMEGDAASFREWIDRVLSQIENVVVLEPEAFRNVIDSHVDALAEMGGANG